MKEYRSWCLQFCTSNYTGVAYGGILSSNGESSVFIDGRGVLAWEEELTAFEFILKPLPPSTEK